MSFFLFFSSYSLLFNKRDAFLLQLLHHLDTPCNFISIPLRSCSGSMCSPNSFTRTLSFHIVLPALSSCLKRHKTQTWYVVHHNCKAATATYLCAGWDLLPLSLAHLISLHRERVLHGMFPGAGMVLQVHISVCRTKTLIALRKLSQNVIKLHPWSYTWQNSMFPSIKNVLSSRNTKIRTMLICMLSTVFSLSDYLADTDSSKHRMHLLIINQFSSMCLKTFSLWRHT